jgi:hypothetical protein
MRVALRHVRVKGRAHDRAEAHKQYKLILHSDYIPLRPDHMSAADAAHTTSSPRFRPLPREPHTPARIIPNISSARRSAVRRMPSVWAEILSAAAAYGRTVAAAAAADYSETTVAHRPGPEYVLRWYSSYILASATNSDCLSIPLPWRTWQSTCGCGQRRQIHWTCFPHVHSCDACGCRGPARR